MELNQNYPWYIQKSESFNTLYNDLFETVSKASPLDVYKMFYPDEAYGAGLLSLAEIWRITGNPAYIDALIYNMDEWSHDKVWTGGYGEVRTQILRNVLKAKIYMQGRQFCLASLKTALEMIFEGTLVTFDVTEDYMSFEINISGPEDAIRSFIETKSLDPIFFGHIPGIKYTYNYNIE